MIRKRNYFKIFCVIILILILFFGIITHFKNNKKVITIEKRINNFYTTEGTRKMNDGVTYYIASDGTSTDGTNINAPLSLENAKKKTFYNNDNILFKSGDTFYGEVRFNIVKRENDDSLCYITSYGEGEPPKITAAKIIDNKDSWEKYSDNVYRVNLKDKTKFRGFQNIDDNSCNIGFIKAENGNIYGDRKVEISLLKENYDFYCDNTYFYVYCDDNPFNKLGVIKLPTRYNLFAVSSYSEINNLHLELSGAHGFVKNGNLDNSYIHNCIINDIGGTFQYGNLADNKVRFGNAIEFWNGASNVLIEKNVIDNTYDAGITLQGNEGNWSNIIIRNNIIKKSNYPFELWEITKTEGMENIQINENLIIDQGKSWAKDVKPDQGISSNFVFYTIKEDNNFDVKIYNNNFWNSTRTIYVKDISKNKIKECTFDENEFYYDKNTYTHDNVKEDNPKTYLNATYHICENDRFYRIDENFMDNIEKIDHNSINFDYLWNSYSELEKEYKRFLLNKYFEENEKIKLKYEDIYSNYEISDKYNELINLIDSNFDDANSIDVDKLNNIYSKQFELYNISLKEFLYNKLNFNSEDFNNYRDDMELLIESYRDIIDKFHKSEQIDKESVKEKLNNVIKKYNENSNLNESNYTELIKKYKELYENGTETDNIENNYYNLSKIYNYCDIIDTLLDYNINKSIAINIEYKNDGSFKPVINGKNINKVEVYKENKKIDYNLENSIYDAGIYTIKVNNSYGFSNFLNFIFSKKYEKDEHKFKYITINENSKLNDIKIDENTKLFNEKMQEKGKDEIIKTGDIFKSNSESYFLIIKGDVNKDGRCSTMDLVKIRKAIINTDENDDIQNIAADLCEDNNINIKDLIIMRNKLID